jgi:hypothetical protein
MDKVKKGADLEQLTAVAEKMTPIMEKFQNILTELQSPDKPLEVGEMMMIQMTMNKMSFVREQIDQVLVSKIKVK